MAKLIFKIKITGDIKVITGLHIGGSDSDLDIGGIDNSVIKTKDGIPYIPGSSLKGKLRDLIARSEGSREGQTDSDVTKRLFCGNEVFKKDQYGETIKKDGKNVKIKIPTRLLTRDCFMVDKSDHLEDKTENTIIRSTGVAVPRHMERVFPETVFKLDMILDVWDVDRLSLPEMLKTLRTGFKLLENDYLGGSGSRGYGKVEFHEFSKSIAYQNEEPAKAFFDFNF